MRNILHSLISRETSSAFNSTNLWNHSRSLDRRVSGVDIGTGSDFLSAVTLGFTSCGTLIITYSAARGEVALKLWKICSGHAEAVMECPLFMTQIRSTESSRFAGSEAIENLKVFCPGRNMIVVHGWPEVITSAESPTHSHEVGHPVSHYATVIPIPERVRRGHDCIVKVLHFQWESLYDPHFPPSIGLRAYALPRTSTRLSADKNSHEDANQRLSCGASPLVEPDVLLEICTGTRVSLVPLVQIREYSNCDATVQLCPPHTAVDSIRPYIGCHSRGRNWMSEHRYLYTCTAANDLKPRHRRPGCSSAEKNYLFAARPEVGVSVGPEYSDLDCDEFVRSSIPRCLGHSDFELLDFFVLPCVPGAHTLATASSCNPGHISGRTDQGHDQPLRKIFDQSSVDREHLTGGTSGKPVHVPIVDVAPISSVLIVTALVRTASSVNRNLTASTVDPSLRLSNGSTHSAEKQTLLTAEMPAPIAFRTAPVAQQKDPYSNGVCALQQHAGTLAQQLQATRVWQIPTRLYGKISGTQCEQPHAPTHEQHPDVHHSYTCDSASHRHRDMPNAPNGPANPSALPSNEAVAVRSITFVALVGSCNGTKAGACCTSGRDMARRCSECRLQSRCPPSGQQSLAISNSCDLCNCIGASQATAFVLGYRHSSAQLNRAHEALKAAAIPEMEETPGQKIQAGNRAAQVSDGETVMSRRKRLRAGMQYDRVDRRTSVQNDGNLAGFLRTQESRHHQTRSNCELPLQQRLHWAGWQVTRWAATAVQDCLAVPAAEATHVLSNRNVVQQRTSLLEVTSPCCPIRLVKYESVSDESIMPGSEDQLIGK